jgi:hypothetical protein
MVVNPIPDIRIYRVSELILAGNIAGITGDGVTITTKPFEIMGVMDDGFDSSCAPIKCGMALGAP